VLQRWAAEWSDLIEFEIVSFVQGKDTGAALSLWPAVFRPVRPVGGYNTAAAFTGCF
jgi:hypothetical protein